MSNTRELKQYLLEKENAFLLDDFNNGKTIMLSGVWGAGKTYFWQKEIEPSLSEKLKNKNKACVYVSLYGKESISDIKSSIFLEAYKSVYNEDLISKTVSKLSDVAKILGKQKNVEAFNELNRAEKDNKSKELLENGSVICLDDFERKSKKIDLNDLFGLISDLALSLECKIVIILNSDVFTGKEAEVFRNVKEKTVNKFFYFEPTIEELFKSISSQEKYNDLEEYKDYILKAIKETEELNARIYIQVLDNCLEWLRVKENLDENIVRVLVLGTFNFVLNHMVLDYQKRIQFDNNYFYLKYTAFRFLDDIMGGIRHNSSICFDIRNNNILYKPNFLSSVLFIERLKYRQVTAKEFPEERKNIRLTWIKENEQKLKALWKYGYRLYYVGDVEEEIYNEIAKFIKSGILI